jgi:hypothetical protein
MKSHFSKAKVAALAVGLAIVVSSCGIQNQAGDSSSAPAAGKTKNAALTSEWCYVTGKAVDLDAPFERWTIRKIAQYRKITGGWRFGWNPEGVRIDDLYGPSIVKCSTLKPINVAGAAGATSAEELPPAFVESSTANQCITVENRKKTLQGYDEQIMAHSLDADKTIYEQMKTGRWITTLQRPCNEAQESNPLSALACVSVSHKAFEVAFYNEQYELHKDEAGTPYLDLIIIGKEKANALVTC